MATIVFVAGFYGLYFGGIFDAAVSTPRARTSLMNLHFLMSGYLFYWVVIGVDPTPRPIPPLGKIAMVFASLPLHAFFGVVLMGTQTVLGESFYRRCSCLGTPTCSVISGSAVESPGRQAKSRWWW